MKTKFRHRLLALVMAGMMCLSVFPSTVLAENISEPSSVAVFLPANLDEVEGTLNLPGDTQSEDSGEEQQAEEADEDPLPVEPDQEETSEAGKEDSDESPELAEKCAAYDHTSDSNGICMTCGTDLTAEFISIYHQVTGGYTAKLNAWGWYEQHLDENDSVSVANYESAKLEAESAFSMICEAADLFSCFELELADGVSEELRSMLYDLYLLDEAGRMAYQYPQNPAIFGTEPEENTKPSDDVLYDDLPDAPTGSYMGSRGLPIAVGNTKISISGWNADFSTGGTGRFDVDALNADSAVLHVAKEPGKSYAIVPVMTQVEYPANGSSSYVTLPDGVEVLCYGSDEIAKAADRDAILYASYEEMSASLAGFYVRASDSFTATFTYVDDHGDSRSKSLQVIVGDTADDNLQRNAQGNRAAILADRPVPSATSGKITKTQFVNDTWLIWFNGEEAYCCNHGLQGKPNGCPTYGYSATSVISADQYKGDHYSNQVSIWGGLDQLSLGVLEDQHSGSFADSPFSSIAATHNLADEALLQYCYRIYDDRQMHIIVNYPDSDAAKIYMDSARAAMSGVDVLASNTGYYTYIYTPPIGGWQTVAVIGPACDEEGEEVTPEYYADWSAPPQTKSGDYTFNYKVSSDKYQLETKEKVDNATIDVEPITKSGTIDGGSWSISPDTKQTIITGGHTMDEAYHLNGGDGSVSWSLHYEVTKTSGSQSGTVGPYSSQSEADDAASSARSSAISALQAEAQAMVDAAIAQAKSELNTLQFTYNEMVVPYGFLAYNGNYGSNQTLNVEHDTENDYPMQNDEWSMKVFIEKIDSETHQQIAGDSEFQIFEYDVVSDQYIPYGGYNQYKAERQQDGTYKVVNHSDYATTPAMQETMYFTQRNLGKFIIVETTAPSGYFGDWSNPDRPGTAGTPLGKRAYYIEITRAKDGSTIWLDNLDYNADVATKYTTGQKLLTAEGVTASVTIGNYKDAAKVYNTDYSGTAANEDSYSMTPMEKYFQNDRVLGEISMSKVDLDAVRYVSGRTADGSALKSGESHGDASLEGAIFDLYAASDIEHPDGRSGVVDYSKIVDADGNPIWHTTIYTNAGEWVSDYLPVLCKDHLVASAKIVDGWLTFSNLYLGDYYVVERSTGTVIPVQEGVYKLSGSYPQIDAKTKQATGGLNALAKNSVGQYTDWVYRNQFSGISQSKALDGTKTYDGYYASYADGYLCDEHNYYISPSYASEAWYVEKITFEDVRQASGEERDTTRYSANYHIHRDNALTEAQDQVMKTNVQISKVVSSTGQSNGLELQDAGFTFYLISDLSKAEQFTKTNAGLYRLDSILEAYINRSYTEKAPKYDFSKEGAAIAKCYEVNTAEIEAYNQSLVAGGDHRNGNGSGWVSTGVENEYQLSELFSNDSGMIRVHGLPAGQYICVETTVPKDVLQAEPFIVVVDANDSSVPQSHMAAPKDAALIGSDSHLRYTILDEEMETYLRIVKIDEETGKPVLLKDFAYQIYWMDDDGNYRLDKDGNPRKVTMTDTTDGHLMKNIDTFRTTEEGILTLPEVLPLGHYRIVEVEGQDGFYNEWVDCGGYYVDFEVTTDRIYQATGDDNENSYDTLVIEEKYFNHETLGTLLIRKTGEVLVGWEEKDDSDVIDPTYSGEAVPGDFRYEVQPLAGAEYTITAAEDIYTQDCQLDAQGNRTLWYAAGDTVAVVTTGDGAVDEVKFAPGRTIPTYDFLSVIHDGTVGEVRMTLPLGSYDIRETKPPYGMVGTDLTYRVRFEWSSEKQDVVMASTIIRSEGEQTPVTSSFEVVPYKAANSELIEKQTLGYYNEREKARVGIFKIDRETGKYLAGARYNLFTADDIYDIRGNKLFSKNDLVATSPATLEDGYTFFRCDIPIRGERYGISTEHTSATNSGNFFIQELVAPEGYYLSEDAMEVSFLYDGQVLEIIDNTCANKASEVWFSKRELTGDDELPGATLTLTDAHGEKVCEWVSGTEPHRITGLHFNEVYTFTETRPADGYAVADSIRFLLVQHTEADGKLAEKADVYTLTQEHFLFWSWEDWILMDDATVIMRDDTIKVNISKTDIVSGEELPGAEIIIRDSEGNEIERWISEDKSHYIEKLPAGDYTLEEITAPDGYAVSEKVPFTVEPIGTIQSVVMKDAPYFEVDKTKVGGELLPGAELSIRDKDGNIIDKWITIAESHKVKVTGADDTLEDAVILSDFFHDRIYTLHEDASPAGYALASNIQFKVVRSEGQLQVYVRGSSKEQWKLMEEGVVTMVDHLKPKPTPDPGPTPTPEQPQPTPVPTPAARFPVPKTGDDSAMALYFAIAGVAFSGLALVLIGIYKVVSEKRVALVECKEESEKSDEE